MKQSFIVMVMILLSQNVLAQDAKIKDRNISDNFFKDIYIDLKSGYAMNSVKIFFKNTENIARKKSTLNNSSLYDLGIEKKINDKIGIGMSYSLLPNADFKSEYRINEDQNTHYETEVDAKVRSHIFLINLRYNFDTYNNISPFVGFGVGVSRNKIDQIFFKRTGYQRQIENNYDIITGDNLKIFSGSSQNFAWQISTGLSYKINSKVDFDFGYRYMDLGSVNSSDIVYAYRTHKILRSNIDNSSKLRDIHTSQIMFGLKFKIS